MEEESGFQPVGTVIDPAGPKTRTKRSMPSVVAGARMRSWRNVGYPGVKRVVKGRVKG
jgi:hypothetical protein